MNNELSDRQQAIQLRWSGRSVEEICRILGRSPAWFHIGWCRYRALGRNGLFDLTRANLQPRRISPELEQTLVSVRQRLASQTPPGTRYSLIEASSIVAELQARHLRPVPSLRTIERVLERNPSSIPKVRLAPYISSASYPAPTVEASNPLHPIDSVGPLDWKGQRQRSYIFVCKDIYDRAVCLRIYRARRREVLLDFLGECGKHLGLPAPAQFDQAREVVGWGRAARDLSRVLRVCLRFGIEPLLIPPARPQRNGSIENCNGWFQPRLLQRHYAQPRALKRELQRLEETVNTQPVQPRLAGLTPMQHRKRTKLRKLPPGDLIPHEPLPFAAGRITFFRQVTAHGTIHLLSQTFKVGQRLKGAYVKVLLDTQRAPITVYRPGRIFQRWSYPFLKK